MRKYESTVLIRPTLEPNEALEVSNKLVKLLEDNGAKVTAKNNLEKTEKVAFEVKGHKVAYWQTFSFESNPEAVAEFERICKIDDNVIRYLTVRLVDKKKKETKKVKKETVKEETQEVKDAE